MEERLPFKEKVGGPIPPGLTESNSASLPKFDEVAKFDLAPKVYFVDKTSDVLDKEKYYVYVLFSLKDKRLYIGLTGNLKNRLAEHARGKVKSTQNRRPLKLIHYQYFINRVEAERREIFLKSGFGRSELKKYLRRTLASLGYKYL